MTGATRVSSLLSEIGKVIGRVTTASGALLSHSGDVYEVLVFTRAAKVIKTHIDPGLRFVNRRSGVFIARGSPGKIYSTSFSYARFTANSLTREMHLGIKIDGYSGVGHEADISILPLSKADIARHRRRNPERSSMDLVIECKFYKSPLPLGFGRGLLGYAVEVNNPPLLLVTNTTGNSIDGVLKEYESYCYWPLSLLLWHNVERWDGDIFQLGRMDLIPEFANPPGPRAHCFDRAIRASLR